MSIQTEVTDKIIAALESGAIPWQQPWKSAYPENLFSGKPYRGINVLLLSIAAMSNEWNDPRFATFKQISEHGGRVLKGAKSVTIVFAKSCYTKFDPARHSGKPDEKGMIQFPIWKPYHLFNIAQTAGLEKYKDQEAAEFVELPQAEDVIANMPMRPEIKFGGNEAYYALKDDFVQLPTKTTFATVAGFYQTEFHELAHATGHKSRLGRFSESTDMRFGSGDYSREELIAELCSAFLMAHCGMDMIIENSAAYIKSWLGALQADKSMVMASAGKAQKAFDFIIGKPAQYEAAE
jgi:antirestriction protein ArdC